MTLRPRNFFSGAIDFAIFVIVIGFLKILSIFPIHVQQKTFIFVFASIFAPLMNWPTRIEENLKLVRSDINPRQRNQIAHRTLSNLASTLFEVFRPTYIVKLATNADITGPGVEFLEKAISNEQPVILLSGHFGNYDVIRAKLIRRGMRLGALYRPLNNLWLNKVYLKAISETGEPLFPRSNPGFTQMLRYIKCGGSIALLIDQHMDGGLPTSFFGKPAFTSSAAAKLSIKYGMPLIPIYAIRQPQGNHFTIWTDEPIEFTNELEMTQAFNDNLELVIREHMDQWSWPHRRWKPSRRKGKIG